MALDTFSARLGMLEMGTGNQNNSWGTSFNNSVTDVIDRAIAGVNIINSTGGTVDLSATVPPAGLRADIDFYQRIHTTLTSDVTIILPAVAKTWWFSNGTNGPFNVYVKMAGGNTIQIPQGLNVLAFSVIPPNMSRFDVEEIGSFRISGKPTPGAGELACNGASYLRTTFPDLFLKIGTTWGAVDGTHFNVPLLTDTNRFLRAAGGSLAVGTYQTNQNKAHTHTGSGTTSGVSNDHTHTGSGTTSAADRSLDHLHTGTTVGMNSNQSHSHGTDAQKANGQTSPGGGGATQGTGAAATINPANIDHSHNFTTNGADRSIDHLHTYSFTTSGFSANHTHTYSFTTSSDGGTEARPESAAVLICIKY